jgi:hypothetical protein
MNAGRRQGAAGIPGVQQTLVTTRDNAWVFGVGNDFDRAVARTPGAGQSLVHQYLASIGDTYWVQKQNNPTALSGTSVTINGSTVTTVPGQASSSATGGVLALPSNIGDISRTRFSAVPELDINFRYQLTRLWRFNVGYTFMYVTNVARPGDQISLSVDPRQFPPPVAAGAFPAFRFNDSDLWLHGINLGLEARF